MLSPTEKNQRLQEDKLYPGSKTFPNLARTSDLKFPQKVIYKASGKA